MRLQKPFMPRFVGGVLAAALLVAVPACGASTPQAQPSAASALPATPAGREAAALLQVFNEGNGSTMLAFIKDHYAKAALAQRPAEQHLGMFGQLWDDTNGLTFQKVETSSEPAPVRGAGLRQVPPSKERGGLRQRVPKGAVRILHRPQRTARAARQRPSSAPLHQPSPSTRPLSRLYSTNEPFSPNTE